MPTLPADERNVSTLRRITQHTIREKVERLNTNAEHYSEDFRLEVRTGYGKIGINGGGHELTPLWTPKEVDRWLHGWEQAALYGR